MSWQFSACNKILLCTSNSFGAQLYVADGLINGIVNSQVRARRSDTVRLVASIGVGVGDVLIARVHLLAKQSGLLCRTDDAVMVSFFRHFFPL